MKIKEITQKLVQDPDTETKQNSHLGVTAETG